MSPDSIPSDSSSGSIAPTIQQNMVPPLPPPPPNPNTPHPGAEGESSNGNGVAPNGTDSASPQQKPPAPQLDTQMETKLDARVVSPTPVAPSPGNQKSIPPVPPPPPPRSQPARPRPMPEISATRSGVGSANIRWRGNLPNIETEPAEVPPDETSDEEAIASAESEETAADTVARSAPSWLLSLVIHLIVLLILALLSSPTGRGITSLVIQLGFSEDQQEEAVELELLSSEATEDTETAEESLEDSLVEMDLPDVFETVQPADEALIQPDLLGDQPIEFSKPMFGGRTGAMRKALMAMFGATDETEQAVKLGLEWLKRQQNRQGYWSLQRPYTNGGFTESRAAATAMALIAFAGDGNTHLGGPYQKEVESGLKWLVSQQDRGGFMAKGSRSNHGTYAQAQATIALCELYAMTHDSWLRAYAQRAVDYALKSQGPNGGWRYRPREPGDTSVTGWYVMALQSAMAAGLDVNDSKVRKISDFLDSVSHYNGAAYSYQPGRPDRPATMTAEGLLCRMYLGWEKQHPALDDGIRLLSEDAPFESARPNVYYWYYATQVFHHYGGPAWTEWNNEMKVKLPELQIKVGKERGSWAPQNDPWAIGGRLYTTCLSIYCLEVYYRHLPLYGEM